MEQLSLNLTVQEINLILDALGEQPYKQVFPLVEKIKAQAEAQVRQEASRNHTDYSISNNWSNEQ
ncbi:MULTISPECIES: hypothetical protein [Leptolyngbya]|uniref:hypothetical protein n=1 Tax=Leptolyngbya TaxID=47251 RepID=UPI0016879643|nr:hypothetical protein [Leptolyngbya sp. FACHB-1624]MBD1857658.1 hypothetical protein [Leptolyngbya sp. FACHB-1624]